MSGAADNANGIIHAAALVMMLMGFIAVTVLALLGFYQLKEFGYQILSVNHKLNFYRVMDKLCTGMNVVPLVKAVAVDYLQSAENRFGQGFKVSI